MAVTLGKSWTYITQAYLGYSHGDTYIRLYGKYSGQDTVGNYTYGIQFQARVYYNGYDYIRDDDSYGSVYGDGCGTKNGSADYYWVGETTICTTDSGTVYHNANGTRTIGAFANLTFPNWNWSAQAISYDIALPTINRTAPTVTMSASATTTTSLTISAAAGSTCNSWDYSIDNASWVNYSTASGTSTSKTITGLSSKSHTVRVRACNTANYLYGTSSQVTVDLVAPVVSMSVSNITTNGMTLTASSDVNCNIWQYSLNNGTSWTQFSTTNGRSASVTLSSLSLNTSYTVKVRARKTSNSLYGSSASQTISTLGNSRLNSVSRYYPDSSSNTVTFNWTVFVSSYRHKLQIKNGNTVIATFDNLSGSATTTNNSVTITDAQKATLLSLIPSNETTKTITMALSTYASYSGGTYGSKIGNDSVANFVLGTTSDNSGPILTCSVLDINDTTIALTGDNTKLIKNASNAQCVMAVTPRNNATITANTINNVSTTSYTFNKVSASSFVFTATDSRGYTTTRILNPRMIDYVAPTCIVSAERVSPVSSNQIYLTFSGRYYSGYFGDNSNFNTLTIRYRFKEVDESSYSPYVTIDNSNISTTLTSYASNPGFIPSSTFNYSKAYNIRLVVSDRINTVSTNFTLVKGVPICDWGENDFAFHVDVSFDDGLFTNNVDLSLTDGEFANLVRVIAEEYSSSRIYYKGEVCCVTISDVKHYYEATQHILTPENWNSAHWEEYPWSASVI